MSSQSSYKMDSKILNNNTKSSKTDGTLSVADRTVFFSSEKFIVRSSFAKEQPIFNKNTREFTPVLRLDCKIYCTMHKASYI